MVCFLSNDPAMKYMNKSLMSPCSHQQRLLAGVLQPTAAAPSSSCSVPSSMAAPPHSRHVGCHRRIRASLHHASKLAAHIHTHNPSRHTITALHQQGGLGCAHCVHNTAVS